MLKLFWIIVIFICAVKCATASAKYKNLRCKKNEVLSTNDRQVCGYKKCSEIGKPIECVMQSNMPRKKTCVCKETYLRARNGTCIPANQCPNARKCPKPNESYTICPPTCPARVCNVVDTSPCPEPLDFNDERCPPPACRCNVGFYRDVKGNCVTWNLCNSTVTNPTEAPTTSTITKLERTTSKPPEKKSSGPDSSENAGNGLEKFEQGNVIFTDKFLYESAKQNPGVSLIFSPFSVLFLLAQLALYAMGPSLQQLLGLLNLGSKTDIRSLMPNYLDELNSQQNVSFSLAEKVYGNIQYKFRESFKKDTREIFRAEAQNLDFCKPSQAAYIINKWVANETNNLIKDLVSPSALDCNTVLALVNAIYFKGDWLYPFDPKNTIKDDFYVNKNKDVTVNMMKQTRSFKYAEINDAQVIELPYKGDNFSLMIWLPKNKDGIDNLVDKMGDPSFSLNTALSSLNYNKVILSLPSFSTSTTTDLKYILMKANVTSIFNPDTSGLAGIIEESKPLYVSSGIQKATIIVNELGSEAAAANAVIVSTTAVMANPPIVFLANHPFVYCILFRGTPIFCGIYYGIS